MRKSLLLLLILALIIVPGCSGEKTTTIETEDGDVEVTVDEGGDTTTIEMEDTTVEVSQEMKESVDIPDTYPHDFLPIYKDMFVAVAMENQDGSISLVGMSEDSQEDVVEFYEKITEDYHTSLKERSQDTYTKMGDYDGMIYTVSVVPDDDNDEYDYETLITLMVIPGSMDMDMTPPEESGESSESTETTNDDSSDNDGTAVMDFNGMEVPSAYPDDILPIINNRDTKIMAVQSTGDEMMIGFMTKDPIEDVIKFYEDALKDAPDASYLEMGPNKMLSGTIDDHRFDLMITENTEAIGEDPSYKTLVQLMYSKE